MADGQRCAVSGGRTRGGATARMHAIRGPCTRLSTTASSFVRWRAHPAWAGRRSCRQGGRPLCKPLYIAAQVERALAGWEVRGRAREARGEKKSD
jgi:hypothetical protein